MKHDDDTTWERAPVCFACGKEIGTDPEAVIYVGYGHRHNGRGPGWVASLCSCEGLCDNQAAPSPCLEAAQAFATEDGAPLSPEEYRRWLSEG